MEEQHKEKIPILENFNYVDIKKNLKILRIEKISILKNLSLFKVI